MSSQGPSLRNGKRNQDYYKKHNRKRPCTGEIGRGNRL